MMPFQALSRLGPTSRPAGHPLFVDQNQRIVLDWAGFCHHTAIVRKFVQAQNLQRWIIADSDVVSFATAMLAVLQAGCEVLLPRNLTAHAQAEIMNSHTGILTESPGAGFPALPEIIAAGSATGMIEFPPIDPRTAQFRLFTSGSTGLPQEVPKKLFQIEAELANLHGLWGNVCAGRTVYSTVQHHHFYGLLFYVLFPLCAGLPVCVDMINYPEGFSALRDQPVAIVGSPAFYKRFVESAACDSKFATVPMLFSSGGYLPSDVAIQLASRTGSIVHEIYGSTETGGIAWRESPSTLPWQAFPGINLRIDGESRILVRSPYLGDADWLVTGDQGSLEPDGGLRLQGRVDSIVKIEEKRVSLSEVERRLRESPLVADVRVIAMADSRQFLAAVVIPSPTGREWLDKRAKQAANVHFRDWLRPWFEATVLPRKWRFVDAFPQDSLGKITHSALAGLFSATDSPKLEPDGGIRIDHIDQVGDHLSIEFHVPLNALWFQGHFPSFPLLPGVVQIDWMMQCVHRYLGLQADLKNIPRLKFMKPIRPDTPMRLDISLNRDILQVSYQYSDRPAGVVYSSGKLNLGQFA